MSSLEFYSLDQIEHYLLSEHPGLHGISPQVYEQNVAVAGMMARAAELMKGKILGFQLLGSRAHGSAGVGSDFDTSIMAFKKNQHAAQDVHVLLRHTLLPYGVEIDSVGAAAYLCRVWGGIPEDGSHFVEWVSGSPTTTIGLYEQGVYRREPELGLCALAAMEVIATKPDPQAVWGQVRASHAGAFLGTGERLRGKLCARLPYDASAIEGRFTDAFVRQRTDVLGLPVDFDAYRGNLADWATAQTFGQLAAPAAQLLESVRAAPAE